MAAQSLSQHTARAREWMLGRLLREYLARYKPWLSAVVALQFVQTLAALYLPTLNADIIDNGVVKGDTGYIMRIGARDARRLARADRAARSAPSTSARGPRWLRPRRAGRGLPPGAARSPPAGGQPVRRAVADHPHHQRRAAGADAGADDLHDDGLGADHVRRRHRHGAAPGRRRCPGCWWSRCPCWSSCVGLIICRMLPLFRHDAEAHRRGQPGAARADHRHPGDPGVRARAATSASASASPTTSSPRLRCPPAG